MKLSLLFIAALFWLRAIFTQERPMHEVYSLMIFNFVKFTQWPEAEPKKELKISIMGNTEVYGYMLTTYNAKKIRAEQTIVVEKTESVDVLTDADVVFIDGSRSKELATVLEKCKGKSTLVITNRAGLASKGSCINFRVIDGRLRFEVNTKAVEAAKLKLANSITSMAILI